MSTKKSVILLGFILFFAAANVMPAVVGDAVKTFNTPAHHPTGICYDSDSAFIWLADSGTHKIYTILPKQ